MTHDFVAEKAKADELGVDKIPAIVIGAEDGYGIRFFGITSGYEYMSLLEAIVDVSRRRTGLAEKTRAALAELAGDVHIQVFVTPTCPYCTISVRLAHQFVLESPCIRAGMVEAMELPHLAQEYHIFGFLKTVMNETILVEGAVPESTFLGHVLLAAKIVK